MVKLAEPVYLLILTKTVLIAAVLTCIIIATKVVCTRKHIWLLLANIKTIHLMLLITLFSIAVFISYISIYKIHANKDFEVFLKDIGNCTTLQVSNLYYSDDQKVVQRISVDDLQMIAKLVEVIEGAEYKWTNNNDPITSMDFVKFELFKDEIKLFDFRIVVSNILEISTEKNIIRYFSSDLQLLLKTRKLLDLN